MASSPGHVVAIVNPETRRDARRIVSLLELATPPGSGLEIHLTAFSGHAVELAAACAERADVLVAVGGDGTVADVAGVCRTTGTPLGIVPGGSTNIIARELGIPTNPFMAIQLIFGDHAHRSIDAGICGERTFLHMAGAGVDSLLFERSRPALKRKVGWMAYVPAALEAMRQPMQRYTVTSDERTLTDVQSPLVLVANGPSIIAPSIQLDRGIVIDDGLLDVFVVTATSAAGIARVLARMATRQFGTSPLVESWQTRAVEIQSESPIAIQLDGDVTGTTPIRLEVVPSAVQVIVPNQRS